MEGNSFLSSQEKRSGTPDPVPGFRSPKTVNQNPQLYRPMSVPKGHVAFRILCLASQVGAVIGKSGSVIKQIQKETDSKIHVGEEAHPDSPDRVITIIARTGPTSRVKLGLTNGDDEEEEFEVSKAQLPLIRVFDVLNSQFRIGTVSCRLLIEPRYADALVIKDGAMVEKIMMESGCKVEIREDNLPICAELDDAMVEIEGHVLSVKKALVSVSRCLQYCQPINKKRMVGGRFLDCFFRDALHDNIQETLQRPVGTDDMFSHGNLLRTSDGIPHDAGHSSSGLDSQPLSALEDDNQNLVLKILGSSKSARGVFRAWGDSIETLQKETGASIDVGVTPANCYECLFTFTASPNPKAENSPAQRAILLFFSRIYEKVSKRGSRSSITARLVVPTNQIGWLLENWDCIVSKMRNTTGASMQVLEVEQNPKCISANDRVVQISGTLETLKMAIDHFTSRLRGNLLHDSRTNSATMRKDTHGETTYPGSMGFHPSPSHSLTMSTSPHRRPEDPFHNRFIPTAGYAPTFGPQPTMDFNDTHISPLLGVGNCNFWASQPPVAPRGVYDGSRGLSSTMADLGLGSGHESSIVTNTTMNFRVPENAMNIVWRYLPQLRQMSEVMFYEPRLGTNYRIIGISGTPDQIQTAQAFLRVLLSS